MRKKVYIRNGEYYYSTGIVSGIFGITTEQLTDRARKRGIKPITISAHSYYCEEDISLIASTRDRYKQQFHDWRTHWKFQDICDYLVNSEEEDE